MWNCMQRDLVGPITHGISCGITGEAILTQLDIVYVMQQETGLNTPPDRKGGWQHTGYLNKIVTSQT